MNTLQRRALLGAIVLGLLPPLPGLAMWNAMSDAELVQVSPLVVVGTWVGQTALTMPSATAALQVGVVAVSETLKGAATAAAAANPTVVFVAVPNPSGLRVSTDIYYRKGDTGLWLLRPHPGATAGLYLADNPQRFVPAATGAAHIDALRKLISSR